MTSEEESKRREFEQEAKYIEEIKGEIGKVIIGQQDLIEKVLIALLSGGHLLIEGVPGLAKTLLVKTLGQIIQANFSRIQFTPDMLPADLIGTQIYDLSQKQFSVQKGPIFANLILADEINRAPAKVQSALLEAMQERQVTIGTTTHLLDEVFLVMATQNPIDQEGTYPLPEAQVDRFMLKTVISYPSREEEQAILERMTGLSFPEVHSIISLEKILGLRELIRNVYVDRRINDYILDIVMSTREPKKYGLDHIAPFISYGASPRAGINFVLAARALAFINARYFVIPDDIKRLANDILQHRIVVSYMAEAESVNSNNIIDEILKSTPVP